MSVLIGALILNLFQQGGNTMTIQTKLKEPSKKILEIMREAIPRQSQQMTNEEWEKLESKKQITNSEKKRFHKRVH